MARTVPLSTLRSRWRQRANLEGATSFIPAGTGEEDDMINESVAELYDVLRCCYGQDYYVKTFAITTTAVTDTYALPTDFLSLLGVDVAFGQNIILTARPFMWNERNRYKWYPGWVYSQPVFYRLQAGSIKFIPAPQGGYAITLWYVPTPTPLVAPSDTFDGIAGWEEYVVLDVAIKALTKDGDLETAGALLGQKAAMRARIEAAAGARDVGAPERVQDVSREDGWLERLDY